MIVRRVLSIEYTGERELIAAYMQDQPGEEWRGNGIIERSSWSPEYPAMQADVDELEGKDGEAQG